MDGAMFKTGPGPSSCGIRRGFRKVSYTRANHRRRRRRFQEEEAKKGFGTAQVVIRSDAGVN